MGKFEYLYLAIVIFVTGLTVAALLLWELIRSQLRFRAICDNSGNMVVIGRAITDRTQRIVDVEIAGCNEVYASHLDMSVKDVIGLYIIKDFFNGIEPEWFNVLREVVVTHESRHLEFVYEPMGTRYSGSVFCLSPIRKRCCFIMDEISEEYNRQREVDESRHLMDSVLRLSGVGLWRWNFKTKKFTVIKSIFNQTTTNNMEVLSVEQVFKRIHPDDHRLFAGFTEVAPEKDWLKNAAVFRVKNPQGGWHWLQTVAVKIGCDSDGVPEEMDGVALDVDSLKRSQLRVEEISRELEANQQKLVYTLQQSRTGLCRWDIITDKVSFGDNFWKSVGGKSYDAAVAVPDTMEQLQKQVIPDEPEALADWIRQLREGNQEIDEFYFRCQMTFLEDVWLEVRNTVSERDESGKPLAVSAFVINISEIRKHEQALLVAMREADEASQAKNRFLAVMSHEIRTPLNAIIGFSSIIKRADISEQLQSYAESIKSSGEMLLTLINDLLDLAKMESEKMQLNLQPVSLYDLLNELRDMFAVKVQAKGLYLNIFCPEDLPLFILDAKRIKQVLINLIGNASKFTDMGGITLTVNCEHCEDPGPVLEREKTCRVLISVKDTGEGILKQDFDSIFNPFEQAAGRGGQYVEGSGLGLSICKNLVELMGGRITCTSEVGVGSDFVVSLDNVEVVQSDIGKLNEANIMSLSEKHFRATASNVKSELQQIVFSGLVEKFGNQFMEMQNGMHVHSAQMLVSDLQRWISQYEVPQIQMIINSLEKAVEDFDVAEVKRLSKFLIQQGTDNGA